jgi:hypothetical protein
MKRILKWLETKFSRHSATVEADERHTRTLAALTSLEDKPFVVFESTGSDPYDSGSLDTSKPWKSHSQYKRPF